jgi:hypothetical protein
MSASTLIIVTTIASVAWAASIVIAMILISMLLGSRARWRARARRFEGLAEHRGRALAAAREQADRIADQLRELLDDAKSTDVILSEQWSREASEQRITWVDTIDTTSWPDPKPMISDTRLVDADQPIRIRWNERGMFTLEIPSVDGGEQS